MLVFCSLVLNSGVLAVCLLFSAACFFNVHEHYARCTAGRISGLPLRTGWRLRFESTNPQSRNVLEAGDPVCKRKLKKGKTSLVPKGDRFVWNSSTICQISGNEIYIGNVVQKKFSKDFVGGKNHLNPLEDWLVTYGHHEPIIAQEVFDKVRESRGKKRTGRLG